MKIEIRRVQNGAILSIEEDDEVNEVVYQEGGEAGEIEAFADFLRHLTNNYGPQTSRYSPKRVHISVEPGDKYEPPWTTTSMSADKRTVATDALATLGTIIDDKQKRDAIHLAVEPVIAGEPLCPGSHITIRGGMAYGATVGLGHGIVDPFLNIDVIEIGQRFWFIMYPRMVQSLRHVWTHPAFPDEIGTPSPVKDKPTDNDLDIQKAESRAWLRAHAARVNPALALGADTYDYRGQKSSLITDPDLAYDTLMADIKRGQLTYHGIDMHSRGDMIDADELQYHASVVLGRQVKWDEFEYFSCTC
jgi:hypothetical protein